MAAEKPNGAERRHKTSKASTPQPDEKQNPVHKKAGMPRFEPTPEQRKTVETMAGHGIPHVDIARVIISPRTGRGIDATTLRAAFGHRPTAPSRSRCISRPSTAM